MPQTRINWKLIIVLLLGVAVLSISGYSLRKWQRSRRAESGLSMGTKAYAEQDWEAAARHLGRYLSVSPEDVDALLKYAHAQLNIRPIRRNNIEQAIGAYRTVLRVDETNLEAAKTLIGLYLQMGLPGEAELIASRVIAKQPLPDLQRMLAVALIQQRKFNEASAALRSIIKEHPEYVQAYDEIGRLAEKRPEMFSEQAQFWFDQAVKNNPSNAEAYIVRGSWYLRNKNKDKALVDFMEAQKQDLSDSVIRLDLADAFIDAGVMDAARQHLEIIQKLDPTNQTLWRIWARLALESKSAPMMIQVADEGLKALASQSLDFLPIAAELYIRGGEIKQGQNCIDQLNKNELVPATTEFLEGIIADKNEQHYEAVKHMYRALQLNNKAPLVRLELADILSRLGDKQSAIQQLRILVSENPDFAGARLALAKLLSESGNWDEASEMAHAIMEMKPGNINATMVYIQSEIQILAQNRTDKDSRHTGGILQ